MFKLTKPNAFGNSLAQIDIVDIREGVLKLSQNRYRLILQSSSINFELKSEEEQDAIIDIYQSFLNSISFPIQILIRTREINMDDYLGSLQNKLKQEQNATYKLQLKNYRTFIKKLISDNKILSRSFYLVIPLDCSKGTDYSSVKEQLALRADIINKNLSRLGIFSRQLTSIEVIDLFYSFYSPLSAKLQPISERALQVINSGFVIKGHDEN